MNLKFTMVTLSDHLQAVWNLKLEVCINFSWILSSHIERARMLTPFHPFQLLCSFSTSATCFQALPAFLCSCFHEFISSFFCIYSQLVLPLAWTLKPKQVVTLITLAPQNQCILILHFRCPYIRTHRFWKILIHSQIIKSAYCSTEQRCSCTFSRVLGL